MSGYGKVISGGAQVQKTGGKSINNKLSARSAEDSRRATVAGAVRRAFVGASLSDQQTNNVSAGGKFKSVKSPSNV